MTARLRRAAPTLRDLIGCQFAGVTLTTTKKSGCSLRLKFILSSGAAWQPRGEDFGLALAEAGRLRSKWGAKLFALLDAHLHASAAAIAADPILEAKWAAAKRLHRTRWARKRLGTVVKRLRELMPQIQMYIDRKEVLAIVNVGKIFDESVVEAVHSL